MWQYSRFFINVIPFTTLKTFSTCSNHFKILNQYSDTPSLLYSCQFRLCCEKKLSVNVQNYKLHMIMLTIMRTTSNVSNQNNFIISVSFLYKLWHYDVYSEHHHHDLSKLITGSIEFYAFDRINGALKARYMYILF